MIMNHSVQRHSLEDVQKQIKELQLLEQTIIEQDRAKIIADIKSKIFKYNLTEGDLFTKKGKQSGKKQVTRMVRYHDPETGVTWGGRGKKPEEWSNKTKDELESFKLAEPTPLDTLQSS